MGFLHGSISSLTWGRTFAWCQTSFNRRSPIQMRTSAVVFLAALLMPAAALRGQEKGGSADAAVYRVEFNIHDGSASRRYVMMIEGNDKGVMRLGQKVPYATGSLNPGAPGGPMVATQFNYADVGVNIDCRLNELNGKVSMKASLEISTVLPQDKGAQQTIPSPTIGQLRIDVNGIVNLGKTTMVASVDDPVTSRKFDVEATVTKMN